jgi:hypothetical protein
LKAYGEEEHAERCSAGIAEGVPRVAEEVRRRRPDRRREANGPDTIVHADPIEDSPPRNWRKRTPERSSCARTAR